MFGWLLSVAHSLIDAQSSSNNPEDLVCLLLGCIGTLSAQHKQGRTQPVTTPSPAATHSWLCPNPCTVLICVQKKQSQIVNIFTPCSLESHTSILQAAAYRICLILIGKGKNVFLITSYYFSSSKIQHSPKHICLLFPNSSFILINVKEACKYDRRITKWQNVTESSEQTKRKLHIQIE